MRFRSIAVIGAGNIGVGVATDLVLHGMEAVLVDVSETILNRAQSEVINNVRFAPVLSKSLPRISAEEIRRRILLTTNLDDVGKCDFIVENVTEDWSVKKDIYGRLEQVMPPAVCFGANTSCIPITQIASATARPSKVIGVHFMNPVHLMQTVEVIRGCHTSDATLELLMELFVQLNKQAIVVRDSPGFVSNRISHLFMNEAAFVLQDGVTTAQKVDEVFK